VENKYLRAKYLASQNQFEAAINIIQAEIGDDLDSGTLLLKGKILANLERFDEAVVCLEKIGIKDPEWSEAQAALRELKKLTDSRIMLWYHKYIKRKEFGLQSLLVLFIFLSVTFASLFLADRNDPELIREVNNISAQSENINKSISLMNELIKQNNSLREREIKDIKLDLEQKSRMIIQLMDSLHINNTSKIEILSRVITENEETIKRLDQKLEEWKNPVR
jgi:tetratricopeptide (TPR) repeat protein